MVLRPNPTYYPDNMTQNQAPHGQGQQYGSGYPPQGQYPPPDQYQNQSGYPSQNQYPPQGQHPRPGQDPQQQPQYGESASYYGYNQQQQQQQQQEPYGYSQQQQPPYGYNNQAQQQPPYGYNNNNNTQAGPPALSPEQLAAKPLGSPPPVPPHPSASSPQQQQTGHGPPPAYPGPSSYDGPPAHLEGNFSGSAANIGMDHNYELRASCRGVDGNSRDTMISLNTVLGNDNGKFVWTGDGGNFAGSARNVRLVDGGRVLEAELMNVDGHWQGARVWLDERIGNSDGQLVFV